ncbi:MAG TPA: hypothetical protein VFQ73_12540 [Flavisolibacter sp.]|nr:hypothetical protein [Flavisolibacter sp.]
MVDVYIRRIHEGTQVSVERLRKDLAANSVQKLLARLQLVFSSIAAEAAYEEYQNAPPYKTLRLSGGIG